MDFCKCGSIIINDKCSNEHCTEHNQKSKGWIVDGASVNFKKAVSYREASDIMKRMNRPEKRLK